MLVSPRGGSGTFLSLNICFVLLLHIYLFHSIPFLFYFYFYFFFVFVCILLEIFCGSLAVLFWFELIKNQTMQKKKETKNIYPPSKIALRSMMGQSSTLRLKLLIQFKTASGAVVRRCSIKKLFLEISQNSQENTCAKISFLIKFQVLGLQLC